MTGKEFPCLESRFPWQLDGQTELGADAFILTGHDYQETLRYLEEAEKMELGKPVLVGGSVNERQYL